MWKQEHPAEYGIEKQDFAIALRIELPDDTSQKNFFK
jgi:hypothetical protein